MFRLTILVLFIIPSIGVSQFRLDSYVKGSAISLEFSDNGILSLLSLPTEGNGNVQRCNLLFPKTHKFINLPYDCEYVLPYLDSVAVIINDNRQVKFYNFVSKEEEKVFSLSSEYPLGAIKIGLNKQERGLFLQSEHLIKFLSFSDLTESTMFSMDVLKSPYAKIVSFDSFNGGLAVIVERLDKSGRAYDLYFGKFATNTFQLLYRGPITASITYDPVVSIVSDDKLIFSYNYANTDTRLTELVIKNRQAKVTKLSDLKVLSLASDHHNLHLATILNNAERVSEIGIEGLISKLYDGIGIYRLIE
jgi:hypothetical protein